MDVCPAFIGVLSGLIDEQPVYGIGLLLDPEPRQVTDSFSNLHFNLFSERRTERNKLRAVLASEGRAVPLEDLDRLMWNTRHHEYRFSEVSRSNLQQFIDLMNL